MVVFMVKWALAAIPAILLLAVIGAVVAMMVTALHSSFGGGRPVASPSGEIYRAPAEVAQKKPYGVGVPDRCKGNPEFDKCLDQERRMSQETPEQRAKRQADLEAMRLENMRQIN